MRRLLRWTLPILLGAAPILGLGTPADATSGYRYWAYYLGSSSSWQYSQRGPATEYPGDGQVEGWRFAVQAAVGALAPRAAPDFAALCAKTPPNAGDIRVGIVLDFGTVADAPDGERPPTGPVLGCVLLPAGASGIAALDAAVGAAGVRIGSGADTGLVCGIAGYPRSECAASVTRTTPRSATPSVTAISRPAATPTRPAAAPRPLQTESPRSTTPPPTTSARPATSPLPVSVQASTQSSASAPASSATSPPAPSLGALRATSVAATGTHVPISTVVGVLVVVALAGGALVRLALARSKRAGGMSP